MACRLCPNSTGADIRSVCTEAGMYAIRARRKTVTEKDFLDAVNKVRAACACSAALQVIYILSACTCTLFTERCVLMEAQQTGQRQILQTWSADNGRYHSSGLPPPHLSVKDRGQLPYALCPLCRSSRDTRNSVQRLSTWCTTERGDSAWSQKNCKIWTCKALR